MGTIIKVSIQQVTLVEPDTRFAAEFLEMVEDFRAAGEPYYEEALPLIRGDFPAFVERLRGFARGEGLPPGYCPANEFWLLDESSGKILATIRLRHWLTPHLLEFGGNIGYTVCPGARSQGCGTRMLALLLEKLREPGWQQARGIYLERVLLTCGVDNIASAHIIETNGGLLENRAWAEGEFICRYWIDLDRKHDGAAGEPA